MDLTFQVPMQYCPLQNLILLSSPETFTTEHRFCFGPVASLFLGLLVVVLHSSPVAYWIPSDLGDSSFSVISFCPFIQFMRFSQYLYWGSLPFPPPVDHVLSNLHYDPFILGDPTRHRSYIEVHKPLCHDKAVIHEGECILQETIFNFL